MSAPTTNTTEEAIKSFEVMNTASEITLEVTAASFDDSSTDIAAMAVGEVTVRNWPIVETVATVSDKRRNFQLAEDTLQGQALNLLFKSLCDDTDTAFAQVGTQSQRIRGNGMHRRATGKFTKTLNRPDHEWWDRNAFKQRVKWHMTKGYNFVFEIEEHRVENDL